MKVIPVSKITAKELSSLVKKGKVIIVPTDTVYGLIGDSTNKKTIDRIFKIKKRLKNLPLPLFVSDLKMAEEITEINSRQKRVLAKFWPGPYTFILKRKPKKRIYGIREKTIALRIPKNKLIKDILKGIDCPLTGTSANISGKSASISIKEVIEQFNGQKYLPDIIIDSGNLKKAKPSKIVDLTGKKQKVLRK